MHIELLVTSYVVYVDKMAVHAKAIDFNPHTCYLYGKINNTTEDNDILYSPQWKNVVYKVFLDMF